MTEGAAMRPFQVFWDGDSQGHCIFAPDGCVLVDGTAAAIAGSEDGNVALGELGEALYAHVSGDAAGGYTVEFDGEASKSGAKYSFKVASFGSEDDDGRQYDLATSVVSLGGSATATAVTGGGCYEVVKDDATGDMNFANCYFTFGERLKTGPGGTAGEIAGYLGKIAALKIAAGGSSAGTASLVGYADVAALQAAQEDEDFVIKPLYSFSAEGEIVCDFRNAPAAQVVELDARQ